MKLMRTPLRLMRQRPKLGRTCTGLVR